MSDGTGAYVFEPGGAELRWMGETSTYFLATGEATGGAFCLVDEQASRGESVPLHRHPDDMESFYVLEGELTLFIDGQPGVRAAAGSFAHLPGGTVHGFRVESETARYLILTTPRHGEFYRAITSRRDRAVCRPWNRSKDNRSSRPPATMASSSSDRCQIKRLAAPRGPSLRVDRQSLARSRQPSSFARPSPPFRMTQSWFHSKTGRAIGPIAFIQRFVVWTFHS